MEESSRRWGRAVSTGTMAPINLEGERGGLVAAGEERWRHFDGSVNAVSFGFVATAVLIAMFLVMAIFERFLQPRSRPPPFSLPPEWTWRQRLRRFGRRDGLAVPEPDDREAQRHHGGHGHHPVRLQQGPFASGKLDLYTSPKMSAYAREVSVLMPGQDVPTFLAHPAPVPCPPERLAWPSHQQFSLISSFISNPS